MSAKYYSKNLEVVNKALAATCYFLSKSAELRALGGIRRQTCPTRRHLRRLPSTTLATIEIADAFRAARELHDEGEPVTPKAIASKAATNGDVATLEAWLTDLRDGAVPEGITQKTVTELKRYTRMRK